MLQRHAHLLAAACALLYLGACNKDEPAPGAAAGASGAAPASAAAGEQEEQGTVLRVRKQRGGRTIISGGGVRHEKGPTSYEVQVGLPDGTRWAFQPLQNKLEKGSKVTVKYQQQGSEKHNPVLDVAVAPEGRTVKASLLPALKTTPIGDEQFSMTFPGEPTQQKTDLGTLYRYEYKFDKSYRPDTYYFFRTGVQEAGGRKFFKEQAESMLRLTGGKRISVRMGNPKKQRGSGLLSAAGRFSVEIEHFTQVGRITLWLDRDTLYGAWMHAYSSNRLAAEKEMQRDFFSSFALKK